MGQHHRSPAETLSIVREEEVGGGLEARFRPVNERRDTVTVVAPTAPPYVRVEVWRATQQGGKAILLHSETTNLPPFPKDVRAPVDARPPPAPPPPPPHACVVHCSMLPGFACMHWRRVLFGL
jgi:hypothetical protein